MIKKNFFLIFAVLFANSCYNPCCNDVKKKIRIPVNIDQNYENAPKDYCCIINKALNNDNESIRIISLIDFSNGFIYEHGLTLLELVRIIGENNYIMSIKNFSNEEKNKLRTYLISGLDFSEEEKYRGNDLEGVYPNLDKFLQGY